MTLSPGQRLGIYEVTAPLGAGGMGEVFRARDTRLGREVALKVLPEALAHDPDRLLRFEREARAASALNHPNIVTIHEIGKDGHTAFIAMELVVGRTLRELESTGPLPVRRILTIATQIAEGLAKAHEAGIVHRDLKPDNVMVSKDGFVKILDFGLAKVAESSPGEVSAELTVATPETDPGTVLGTVAYMSPEQASGESIDYRSDQFSLGSMLYEMTTGQKAFQRRTPAETMAAVIREEPQPVPALRADVPVPLRWAMERCLAKDREERYASTRDLARDLARMRDHLSEPSSEVALSSPVPRSPRRRVLAGLSGVALVCAGLLAGWGLTRLMARASPTAPSFRRLTFRQGEIGNARFAPDGQTIVYGARPEGFPSLTMLFRTRVGSPESEKFSFPGDILAISPRDELLILQHLLNPDAADGMMARVPMSSGTPREVLEGVSYAGADFSPDGKELAIARRLDGKDVLEFPAGKVLVPDEASTPRVSHDGKWVAFWAGHFGSFAVSVVDRSGTKRVLSDGWRRYSGVPCWSAGDREIWFTAPLPGQQEALWAVDMSGRRRLVTRVPGSLELDDLSADRRVLIAHHTITQTVRLGSTGQSSERELSWLDASFLADLSDDGRTLLLNEQGEGAGESPVVYLRSVDGSPAVKLGNGLGRSMSPDGKWVLIDERSNAGRRPRLSVLPTGPGEARQLDPGKFTDFGFGAWLPDSAGIVFSATLSDGGSHLYVQPLRAASPRPIGPEGPRLSPGKAVSPDGKFAIGVRAGHSLLIPIEGEGEARVIAGLSPADRVAQWTSDSQGLYFYRFQAGEISVLLLDLKTGHSRPWKQISTTDGGFNGFLRITPDGNTWAYSGRRVQSDLYLVEGLR